MGPEAEIDEEGKEKKGPIEPAPNPFMWAPTNSPDLAPKVSNGGSREPLRWKSHHNTMTGKDYEWHVGKEFGPDHEIWSHFEPGKDRLGVWLCARFGAWNCRAQEATIRVREWFEPAL